MAENTAKTTRSPRIAPAKVPFVGPKLDDARGDRAARSVSFTDAAAREKQLRYDQQREASDFVSAMDDDFLSCRGDRHNFPKLRASKNGKLPRGISASRQVDGCFQLTFTCPDCGTERTRTTLPGGRYDPGAAFTYRYPRGYLSPKDSGLSRSDFASELQDRIVFGGLLS